jgi:hypothetical protein
MIVTITIDPSWLGHPEPLGRILAHIRAIEAPAPLTPLQARQPGDDAEDDLAELLAGMDAPEPAAPPRPAPLAITAPPFDPPRTGGQLYKWACRADALKRCNAIGKAKGLPRMLTEWEPAQVEAVFRELTTSPAIAGTTNGRSTH